ncbi:MAG: hypothetical protein M3Y36_03495 [Actinomycetota bacterium]|nr:hypothetical protein [Actinomycetota bacterium]
MGIEINSSDYTPTWSPNWDDVTFDHARADALINALRAVSRAMETAASQRVTRATSPAAVSGPVAPGHSLPGRGILGTWTGTHRATWEAEYSARRTEAVALDQRITQLITALSTASTKATTEQAHRVTLRQKWNTEYQVGMRRMQADITALRKDGVPVSVR